MELVLGLIWTLEPLTQEKETNKKRPEENFQTQQVEGL